MKEKTRKIFIMIVMAALIVSLMAASFAALTYGRYSGGRRDENSPYEDYIDFVGATAYEVKTPEQFVNAINSGYSYIKIAADAEEPFVVNNDIANVYTNLVIDVNGNTVIRNSRNPVLDVRRNISVVLVYDSSKEQKGGFYNPVGSALQTSGGTLTVGAGDYESGPNEEYQTESYQTGQEVTLFDRGETRMGSYPETGTLASNLPILTGKNAGTQEDPVSVYDFYFESAPEGNVNSLIEADTYLIYTKENNCYKKDGQLLVNCTKTGTEISGTPFSVESNVASCDFYYYYPVGTANEDGFQDYAVIYGYNDVKNMAADVEDMATALVNSGLVWPYAAIRSEAGNTHARGGKFSTHFGTQNTYGIYSKGGIMTVGAAGSSSAAGPAFEAVGEGVCISMSAEDEDTLTIENGEFSSEKGDTIQMEGGTVKITRGTFEKNGSKARPSSGTLEEIEASRTALVHMRGGDLTIDGTFTDKKYSVTMVAGSEQTPLTNVFGIYSEQSSSGDSGTVTVSGCDISVNGTYSAGVLSSAGTVNVGGAENGKPQTKITVAKSIEDGLLTSSAVSSEGGTVNLRNTVSITSDSLGITARGTVNVEGGTTTVNTSNATGVYVNNGTLNVDEEATLDVESTVNANLEWVTPPGTGPINAPNIYNGVYVQGGSLTSNGTLNVDFTGVQSDNVGSGDNTFLSNNPSEIDDRAYREFIVKSYAVRVEGDDSTKVSIAAGEITNDVGGGVLVSGGTVVLGQGTSGPTVSATGTGYYQTGFYVGWTYYSPPYRPSDSSESNWNYYVPSTGGEAVKIVGGGLLVLGGTYTAAQGNGILVNGGESYINGGTFESADGNRTVAGAGASYAFKVLNGTATVYGGTFGMPSKSGSGAFVSGSPASGSTAAIYATANIYGGSFVVSDDNIGNGDSGGQAGFSVLKYANVYFTETLPTTGISLPFGVSGTVADVAIVARGCAAGIAIEKTNSLSVSNATIVIDGGTYQGTRDYGGTDSVWYGNATTKLTIKSGTFTGSYRSGLYIDGDPNSNIQISGGTFGGNSGAFSGSSLGSVTTNEIMTSGARCYYRYYNNDYMICNSNGNAIGGNGNVSVALSDGVYYSWGTSVNYVEAFNTLGTIVVQ